MYIDDVTINSMALQRISGVPMGSCRVRSPKSCARRMRASHCSYRSGGPASFYDQLAVELFVRERPQQICGRSRRDARREAGRERDDEPPQAPRTERRRQGPPGSAAGPSWSPVPQRWRHLRCAWLLACNPWTSASALLQRQRVRQGTPAKNPTSSRRDGSNALLRSYRYGLDPLATGPP